MEGVNLWVTNLTLEFNFYNCFFEILHFMPEIHVVPDIETVKDDRGDIVF